MRSQVIPNWENYTIYENGEVHSNYGNGCVLKQYTAKGGYAAVKLCKPNKKQYKSIHRLLGICFIPNPENKPYIDHIDRNKHNNNLNNLRWATASENALNWIRKPSKGCISKDKNSYRFYWYENKKKKSKCFKTLEEATTYKENFLLKLRMEPANEGEDQSI